MNSGPSSSSSASKNLDQARHQETRSLEAIVRGPAAQGQMPLQQHAWPSHGRGHRHGEVFRHGEAHPFHQGPAHPLGELEEQSMVLGDEAVAATAQRCVVALRPGNAPATRG